MIVIFNNLPDDKLHCFSVYSESVQECNGPWKSLLISQCTELPFLIYCLTYWASLYEGWNFNSGNYLFTTDTK